MLDLAGVLGRCLGADTDGDEEVGEELVPFVHLHCDFLALGGEGEIAVLIHIDVATRAE